MPQIVFNIKSKVDVNQILSAKEFRSLFLGGLPLDKLDSISDDTIDFYINAATNFIEQQLTIKLNKTIIEEDKDFSGDAWSHWNFIAMTYPAVKCLSLLGYLGDVQQVNYPASWIVCRKTNDGTSFNRSIYLVPSQGSSQNQLIIYSGSLPSAGFFTNNRTIPSYWRVKYATGFDVIPLTIKQAIGMTAAIQILLLIDDLISKGSKDMPGLGFGISTNSISLDGLSQNSGTYKSGTATIFGAKIKIYQDQLLNTEKGLLQSLRDFYGGIIFSAC